MNNTYRRKPGKEIVAEILMLAGRGRDEGYIAVHLNRPVSVIREVLTIRLAEHPKNERQTR
jgi:hypothetical protein